MDKDPLLRTGAKAVLAFSAVTLFLMTAAILGIDISWERVGEGLASIWR